MRVLELLAGAALPASVVTPTALLGSKAPSPSPSHKLTATTTNHHPHTDMHTHTPACRWEIRLSVQAHGALELHGMASVPQTAEDLFAGIKGYHGEGGWVGGWGQCLERRDGGMNVYMLTSQF